MTRRGLGLMVTLAGVLGFAAGCSQDQQSSQATPRIVEKVVYLKPAKTTVQLSFLSAELSDLHVTERVNADTQEVTYGPRLLGKLKLRNQAEDQTARLVSGEIVYLDRSGAPIKVADARGNTEFTFPSFSTDRLDPGADLSRDIDVPFPASATNGQGLSELRINLTFLPSPYREAGAAFAVSMVR